jgi:hypothetical protein
MPIIYTKRRRLGRGRGLRVWARENLDLIINYTKVDSAEQKEFNEDNRRIKNAYRTSRATVVRTP